MIFDTNVKTLLEEYKTAREDEAVAVIELLAALRNGNNDAVILETLTKRMEDTHKKAMSVLDRLQAVRPNKD